MTKRNAKDCYHLLKTLGENCLIEKEEESYVVFTKQVWWLVM